MSAEGSTNLDNDTAQDLLHVISARLSSAILTLLQNPRVHDPEEEEIGQLFVWIEVFFSLHQSKLISAVPDFAQTKRLTDIFLQKWEACHKKLHGKVPSERRMSIIKTFETFNAICESRTKQAIIFHEVESAHGFTEEVKSVLDMLNNK